MSTSTALYTVDEVVIDLQHLLMEDSDNQAYDASSHKFAN